MELALIKKISRESKDYLAITFGLVLYALGWAMFLLPYQITTGGVTGISAIIYYATGVEIQVSYFIINAIFLGFALKILGPTPAPTPRTGTRLHGVRHRSRHAWIRYRHRVLQQRKHGRHRHHRLDYQQVQGRDAGTHDDVLRHRHHLVVLFHLPRLAARALRLLRALHHEHRD